MRDTNMSVNHTASNSRQSVNILGQGYINTIHHKAYTSNPLSSSIHDLISLEISDALHYLVSQMWNVFHHSFHIQMTNGVFTPPTQSANCFKSHSNKPIVLSSLETHLFIAMSSLAIFPNNSKT